MKELFLEGIAYKAEDEDVKVPKQTVVIYIFNITAKVSFLSSEFLQVPRFPFLILCRVPSGEWRVELAMQVASSILIGTMEYELGITISLTVAGIWKHKSR